MNFYAKQTGDYFQFICENCNSNIYWEYQGRDPSIPFFKFTCPNCNIEIISKNDHFNDNNLIVKK
jgi:predicted RNA-binding Zn-ribbon protein involved in translation (DUF1610 family)